MERNEMIKTLALKHLACRALRLTREAEDAEKSGDFLKSKIKKAEARKVSAKAKLLMVKKNVRT